ILIESSCSDAGSVDLNWHVCKNGCSAGACIADNHQSPDTTSLDTSPFKMVDSSDNGYTYAYAPTIISADGKYHAYYCSPPPGRPGEWDSIRHTSSSDGVTWSAPDMLITVSDFKNERSACDPSVVYYD